MLGIVFVTEYLRRVKTKTFLAVTLLVPVVLFGALAGVAAIAAYSAQSETERVRERDIAVFDRDGDVFAAMRATEDQEYRLIEAADTLEAAKQAVADGRHYALLVLPPQVAHGEIEDAIRLFVKDTQSMRVQLALRRYVLDAVREVRLAKYDLPLHVRAVIDEQLTFDVVGLSAAGEEESGSPVTSMLVGGAIAMFVLVLAGVYGGTVMQAVMEEKSSRMAEIVLSSVQPFQLMMGKILSVAAVAATQLAIWLAVLMAAATVAALFLGANADLAASLSSVELASVGGIPEFDIRYDVVLAVVCLLPLGYLINASLFAALGAVHENPWEAQMSVVLGMAPSLLAIFMVQTMAMAPNSGLVVFGAFFPFTAPAILPALMLMTDVPVWQMLLSIVLCAAATVGMIWVSARIFRGSLLIYGKKLTLRDVWRVVVAD